MARNFGQILESLIEERSISIAALARKIDVNPKTLSEYVGDNGRFPSNPDVLLKLADFFKCSVHELLTGEPDPHGSLGALLDKTEIHTGLYEVSIKMINKK